MNVTIPKPLAEALGERFLSSVDLTLDTFKYARHGATALNLDISTLHKTKLDRLVELATQHRSTRGAYTLLEDVKTWLKLKETPAGVPLRNLPALAAALKEYLRSAPKHRLYARDESTETWEAYYVGKIEYHPKRKDSEGRVIPDYVTMDLFHFHFGSRHETNIRFQSEHLSGDAPHILQESGYVIESAQLLENYLRMEKKFLDNVDQLGKQFLAEGQATEVKGGRSYGEWWARGSNIRLDTDSGPAKVVIDLFRENEDEKDSSSKKALDTHFWDEPIASLEESEVQEVVEVDEDSDSDEEENPYKLSKVEQVLEVPLHPYLVVFDLRRHMRLLIHVVQLTEYVYDEKLGEKLILPSQTRALVGILLEHKSGFKDIIGGKGAGSVVLCAGPPGTGKTLTAEVYSEVAGRPLYTIQCSQLGLSPDDLEQELLKSFARAQRWKAILLLDEADVYVRSRGNDLMQNAIVGVFLRVLEYYNGVLFLTTNRPDMVDDAIASRCIARIVYEVPELEDQKSIWRVLSKVIGVDLTEEMINELVTANPKLSGRDIKNLLKLASLIALAGEEKVTVKSIEFVKRFKPTGTVEA